MLTYNEEVAVELLKQILGFLILGSYLLSRGSEDIWEWERKNQLQRFYPLSPKGEVFLWSQTRINRIPNEPGYAGMHSEGEISVVRLGTPNPMTGFHEFSHGTLRFLVDREVYPKIIAAMKDEVSHPTPGYEGLDCYLSHFKPVDLYDHHYIMVLAEVTGGNQNLIPPGLRKFYPWMGYAEPESWDEVLKLYTESNDAARRLLRLLYGNQSPYFCESDSPLGDKDPSALPPWALRRIEVFAEAERSLIRDFLSNYKEIAHWMSDDPNFWGRYKEELFFAAELNPDLKSSLLETLRRIEFRFHYVRFHRG